MGKKIIIIVGAVFIVIGLLAFVTNPIVGHNGLFETNRPHDMVHLISGIVLLLIGLTKPEKSAVALKIFGFVYILITLLGALLTPKGGELLGIIHVNSTDHILHLVLGVGLIVLASIAAKKDGVAGSMS